MTAVSSRSRALGSQTHTSAVCAKITRLPCTSAGLVHMGGRHPIFRLWACRSQWTIVPQRSQVNCYGFFRVRLRRVFRLLKIVSRAFRKRRARRLADIEKCVATWKAVLHAKRSSLRESLAADVLRNTKHRFNRTMEQWVQLQLPDATKNKAVTALWWKKWDEFYKQFQPKFQLVQVVGCAAGPGGGGEAFLNGRLILYRGGSSEAKKKVCVPKMGLQVRAPVINFIFFLRKVF